MSDTGHTRQARRAHRRRNARGAAAAAILAFVAVASPGSAHANERRFTYTYGSEVLAPGALELEPWTTARIGREHFFLGLEHRVELEVGIADWVQTAFYFNWSAATEDVPPLEGTDAETTRETEIEWGGVSWEWKFKLADAVADPIGAGLYLEPTLSPTEAEVEAKVLLDKRAGDFYVALNAVGEYEAEYGEPELGHDFVAEGDIGLAYFLLPSLSLGLEVVSHNHFSATESWEHSTLSVGPVVSYAAERWWATLSVLPQVFGRAKDADGNLVLDEHERLDSRLIFGLHL